MTTNRVSRSSWLPSLALGLAPALAFACNAVVAVRVAAAGEAGASPSVAVSSSDSTALRLEFPELAAHVLEPPGGQPFEDTGAAFALRGPELCSSSRLDAYLPRTGTEEIVIQAAQGFAVRVRALGMAEQARPDGRALVYARSGGASFWTATPNGLEEWIYLERGVVRDGDVVAAWEVDGAASVEQDGAAVRISDTSGAARIWVSAPAAFAEGGRPIPVRLEADGARIGVRVEEVRGEAVLIDPSWTTAAPMREPRQDHAATLLADGRVLVAGGGGSANAEIYDPVSNTWSDAAPMSYEPEEFPTATLLSNGNVLVVGGGAASLYDPATDSWTPTGPFTTPPTRSSRHMATLLADGTVLVMGGAGTNTELYDPSTNLWTPRAPMLPDTGGAAVRLDDGRVLVAYGRTSAVYTPATNTWSGPFYKDQPHWEPKMVLLPNGRAYVLGGPSEDRPDYYYQRAEEFDPATNTWTLSSGFSRLGGLLQPTVTQLQDGTTLIAWGMEMLLGDGSRTLNTLNELYNSSTSTFSRVVAGGQPRTNHTATLLKDGRVLFVGGNGAARETDLLRSVDLYNPGTLGSGCFSTADCDAGVCVDGRCCASECPDACRACNVAGREGTCSPVPAGTPDLCPAGMACDVDGECSRQLAESGQPCADGSECLSGSCADGVCCEDDCAGACERCGADGTCRPMAEGTDPDEECAPGETVCGAAGLCDGAGACQRPPPLGTVCGPAACSGSALKLADLCDGEGTCVPGVKESCGLYQCADGACPSRCNEDLECVEEAYCSAGQCAAKRDIGEPCETTRACRRGTCLENWCQLDADRDAIPDDRDNCDRPNSTQADADEDGVGDACADDDDRDGLVDAADNCPVTPNVDQRDGNGDGVGDACDCASPGKEDGAPCDDGNACTVGDACQGGVCAGGAPFDCPQPTVIDCSARICVPASGTCALIYRPDGTPCPAGYCLAGGCFEPGAPDASSNAGAGGTGEGGAGGAAAGGTGGAGGAGGLGGALGAGGALDIPGAAEDKTTRFRGNGCAIGRQEGRGALWLSAGLLLALRRRRSPRRTPQVTQGAGRSPTRPRPRTTARRWVGTGPSDEGIPRPPALTPP
ncbi:kelch repeat-containing protein [Sorangium sp. So ce1182]|uniref:Kelch repeat-containing protein n=1 Tax=Sorangium sp. So ce1182 TaxID=3133334 RepID=UPI003F631598